MKLPGDGQHLGSLRTYFAIAVIMFYDTEIRNNHKEFWETLKTAWENSFDTVIDDKSLASIPIAGEHRFTDVEFKWIAQCRMFLKLKLSNPILRRSVLYLPIPTMKPQ